MMQKWPAVFICSFLFHFVSVRSEQALAPALYVFGDSLVDSGNNNLLPTVAHANYLPYGLDFVNGATGRFTNGMTAADFLAQSLHLPFAPPYFSTPLLERLKTISGFNYASGGAGIRDETGIQLGTVVPLTKQIDAFEVTVKLELSTQLKDPKARSEYLSKSIFMVGVGNNDYLNNYLLPLLYNSSKIYSPRQFARDLIRRLSLQLKRLYFVGAKKFVILGLGPIGCTPNQIRTEPDSNGACVARVNQFVSEFNTRLRPQITRLNATLSGSFFVYGDVNGTIMDINQYPLKYGLRVLNSPCCDALLNGTSGCIPLGRTCPNRDQYFFFDAYHPTEAVNRIVATQCFFNPVKTVCTPISIQQLVRV